MPVCLEQPSVHDPSFPTKGLHKQSPVPFRESDTNCIDIGLVNNMPGAALEATERQFRAQLEAAADGIMVRLALYALPDVPRADVYQRYVNSNYHGINDLWKSHLDGLIVTGTEPRTLNLRDEPYWGSLTTVLEWADQHTHSIVCSCLAAHAALLHIDGISRSPLGEKRFGVFDCLKVLDHPLTATLPDRLRMPHSRWNEVTEKALVACGYHVLTRSTAAGIDTFVKQRKALFVFFQGHPEYEADTLLLEYRRDIGRFLRRERESYPPMPEGYFHKDAADALSAVQEQALLNRREELIAAFPTVVLARQLQAPWRSAALSLYRNWLLYLCAQKARSLRPKQSQIRSHYSVGDPSDGTF